MIRKKVLGIGSYSATLLVQDTEDRGELRVLRRLNVNGWPEADATAAHELYTGLMAANLPGFIHVHAVLMQNSFLNVVTSYCPDGDLATHLEDHSSDPLAEKQGLLWLLVLAKSLQLLHRSTRGSKGGGGIPCHGPCLGRVYLDARHGAGGLLNGLPISAYAYFRRLAERRADGAALEREYPPEVLLSSNDASSSPSGKRPPRYHPTLSDVWHLGSVGIKLLSAHGQLALRSGATRDLLSRMTEPSLSKRITLDEAVVALKSMVGDVRLLPPLPAKTTAADVEAAITGGGGGSPRGPRTATAGGGVVVAAPAPALQSGGGALSRRLNAAGGSASAGSGGGGIGSAKGPATAAFSSPVPSSISNSSPPPEVAVTATGRRSGNGDGHNHRPGSSTPGSAAAAAPERRPAAGGSLGRPASACGVGGGGGDLSARTRALAAAAAAEYGRRPATATNATNSSRDSATDGGGGGSDAARPVSPRRRTSGGAGGGGDGGGGIAQDDGWQRKAAEQFAALKRMNASPPLQRHGGPSQPSSPRARDEYYEPMVSGGGGGGSRSVSGTRRTPTPRRSASAQRGSQPLDRNTRGFNEMFAAGGDTVEDSMLEDKDFMQLQRAAQERRGSNTNATNTSTRSTSNNINAAAGPPAVFMTSSEARHADIQHHIKKWKARQEEDLNRYGENIVVMRNDDVTILAPRGAAATAANTTPQKQQQQRRQQQANARGASDHNKHVPVTILVPKFPPPAPQSPSAAANDGNHNDHDADADAGRNVARRSRKATPPTQAPCGGYRQQQQQQSNTNTIDTADGVDSIDQFDPYKSPSMRSSPGYVTPQENTRDAGSARSTPPLAQTRPVGSGAAPHNHQQQQQQRREQPRTSAPPGLQQPSYQPHQAPPMPVPRDDYPSHTTAAAVSPHGLSDNALGNSVNMSAAALPGSHPSSPPGGGGGGRRPNDSSNSLHSIGGGSQDTQTLATLEWNIDGLRSAVRSLLADRALYGEAMMAVAEFVARGEEARLSPRLNDEFMIHFKSLIHDNRVFGACAPLCVQLVALEGLYQTVKQDRDEGRGGGGGRRPGGPSRSLR